MGLLSLGTPLSWDEAKKHAEHVRFHGITQFLAIWNRVKARKNDRLLWGDEIEGAVVQLDHAAQIARVTLRANEILGMFEHEAEHNPDMNDSTWHPEYGRFMIEGTPGEPYGSTVFDLLTVEANMRRRRLQVSGFLNEDEALALVTAFPRLGCPDFLFPSPLYPNPSHGATRSLFVPDQIINPHARFPTLTANIRRRRGAKVQINVPVFHDVNTPKPYLEPAPDSLLNFLNVPQGTLPELLPGVALPDHVYMDAMAFGMGNSCLQVTFQACSVEEARTLYDQLTPIAPILLALTAATPVLRGHLVDTDVRWNVISASVDDRTDEERGLVPLKHDRFVIPKSRYASVNRYLSSGPSYSGPSCSPDDTTGNGLFKEKYNDLDFPYDEAIYKRLMENGVDRQLALHVATIFIRDPLVIYSEKLDQDDSKDSDHFENLQSTNWQTMRFKPPPPNNPSIGWRVEFRPMEIQLTDFENAAYSIFIVLLTRAILSYNLNFYAPLSKVDENMETAHARDAARQGRFWFRRDVFGTPPARMTSTTPYVSPSLRGTATLPDPEDYETLPSAADEDRYTKMTMDDIMNGNADLGFTGLVPLIRGYVNGRSDIDGATRESVFRYVDYVADKAAGRLLTTATWIRDFVAKHPDYQKDSTVSQKVNYDLMCLVKKIGEEDEAALESLEPYIGQYWKSSRGHVGTHGKLRENGDVVGKRPGDLSNCESC